MDGSAESEGSELSAAVVLFHETVGDLLGLSAADHRALTLISSRAPIAAKELARLTGLTPGAVTGIVDRLARGGHVHRVPDPSDRRRVLITPVDDGSEKAREVFAELGAAMGAMMSRFDNDELAVIAEYVRGTIAVLREQTRRINEDSPAN